MMLVTAGMIQRKRMRRKIIKIGVAYHTTWCYTVRVTTNILPTEVTKWKRLTNYLNA